MVAHNAGRVCVFYRDFLISRKSLIPRKSLFISREWLIRSFHLLSELGNAGVDVIHGFLSYKFKEVSAETLDLVIWCCIFI